MLCGTLHSRLTTADVENAAIRAGRTAVTRFDILGRMKRGAIDERGTDIAKGSEPLSCAFKLFGRANEFVR